jgi:tetratricopeptide (TPR) repeat protein
MIAATLVSNAALTESALAAASNVPAQLGGKQLADTEAQRQALFKQMLADPANVDLALKYAELSSQAGDLEGAISALERLLIFAPQVAQLNYQLGILYLRLGAYEQASTDFKAAIAAPDATPELKASAEKYIASSDQQVKGDYFTGSFVPGIRYQTNANGGAMSSTIDLNGIPFTLSDAALADPDTNAYISAVVHASHDLQTQGDRLNLDASFYASAYAKHAELNTVAGEIQAGPVIALDRFNIKDGTLGLYAILGAVDLGGAPYIYTLGAGGVVTVKPGAGASLSSRFEYRYEDYQNSTDRPTAADYTGARMRLTESGQVQAGDALKLYATTYAERKEAQTGMKADWEAGASLGSTLAFGTSDNKGRPWTLDMQLGLLARLYDTPDPVFSSTDQRLDKAAYVQATLEVPLGANVSATATAGYRKQISNYDLYTYDDASLSLALKTDF